MEAGPSTKPYASNTYISASCNRASNVSDCRIQDGLLAFGSGHFVALSDSSDEDSRGVHKTLPGHKGDVTVLKFLPTLQESSVSSRFLISGDSVGGVIIWKESQSQWSIHATLTAHSQSVSALASMELEKDSEGQETFVVLTGGSDGLLQSWLVRATGAEKLQKLDLKGKIPLELALSRLPESESIVLAIGSTENKIQLFTSTNSLPLQFTKSLSLEGHSDWVRCLTFTAPLPLSSTTASTSSPFKFSIEINYDLEPGQVLLASGSQDNYIRLWRFARITAQQAAATSTSSNNKGPASDLDVLEELDDSAEGSELRVKAHDFQVVGEGGEKEHFACSSEAVLLGHDAWVTGLHWAPSLPYSSSESTTTTALQLLSSSADRSMILWTPTSSIWTSSHRFGEFSSATNLGFFGALWGKDGRSVLAHGWGGSWHVWRKEGDDKVDGERWEPVVGVTGHFGEVKGVRWEPKGEYFVSAGADMTTRLHAPWRRRSPSGKDVVTWHGGQSPPPPYSQPINSSSSSGTTELGRPQIHGYPIASIAFTDRLQFVSGADEKIVRVFDAPKLFLTTLSKLSLVDELGDEESRPMAANVPPLGLSNRAIANTSEAENLAPDSKDPFDALLPTNFTVESHPPFEEQLLGSTLWPETEKLYGHGYEIIALATAHSSPLIATACKATTAEHAVVLLYDQKTWRQVGVPLKGHSLTITSLAFSPDDQWLVSGSRDRTWTLFKREGETYVPTATSKSHARIIWDVCWATDGSFFATASRDKTAKIWALDAGKWTCAATLKFDESATAIACTTISNPPRHLLAVGLENGHVQLFTSAKSSSAWELYLVIDSSIAHVLTVTALDFCSKAQEGSLLLASSSEDRSTRLLTITT